MPMGIDTSIYNNLQPVRVDVPSIGDAAKNAMTLSSLGMQQAQMGMQMRQQMALRQAYAKNTDPATGQVNKQGVLSDLGKVAPWSVPETSATFAQHDKAQAEARSAQMAALHQTVSTGMPYLGYALKQSDDQAAQSWPQLVQQMQSQGLPVDNLPKTWDRGAVQQAFQIAGQHKEALENQLTQANIGAKRAEAALAPVKLQNELYGSRSPNAELTSQYDKQAAPIRSSQLAMKQMIDNYNHPSPQGDASLILNAFKIKFPTAPDVNSLKELSESQAASDQWKQMATKALKGGLDKNTRDNLMRDGVSTFRANYESLQGIQRRYQDRQSVQGVNDPSLTAEPAVEGTFKDAMALQDKIGKYVPPTERPGLMGGIANAASKIVGGKAENSAAADEKTKEQAQYRKAGAPVSADEAAQYATRHKMKLNAAKEYLRSQGYAVD